MRAFLPPHQVDTTQVWNAAQPVLAAVGVIIALVAAIIGATHAPKGEGSSVGDDGTSIAPCDAYVPPTIEENKHLHTIQQELYQGILTWRQQVAAAPLVSIDPQLQIAAQRQAECNAVRQTQPPLALGAPVATISAALPATQANGHAFYELIRSSAQHSDVVVDPRHNYYGIGVASGNGKVWIVMAFSADGLS